MSVVSISDFWLPPIHTIYSIFIQIFWFSGSFNYTTVTVGLADMVKWNGVDQCNGYLNRVESNQTTKTRKIFSFTSPTLRKFPLFWEEGIFVGEDLDDWKIGKTNNKIKCFKDLNLAGAIIEVEVQILRVIYLII